ncbi:aladin [Chrysoperla carnea]|uniref:aladin n=1 Tax=Chrysoperla carnea TaxID=189513 RepID=UPI001D060B22|nr:aladin [Chrysoperla carnea]
MNSTMQGFPDSLGDNEVYICEVDGRLHKAPADSPDISRYTNTVDKHPNIVVTRDMLHGATNRDEVNRNIFLPVQEPMLKKLVHIWYEQGIVEALHFASDPENFESHQPTLVTKSAQFLINVLDKLSRITIYVGPCQEESGTKLISSLSKTNDWATSPIRCISWHPHITKLAVASLDDTIRIYSSESKLVPVLKLRRQRAITCMEWRPMTNCELAVACEQVIIIWNIDPHSVVTRPSSNNAHILYASGHTPIVSLSWSPFGDLLVSAAARDVSIRVWDVDSSRSETLRRSAGGGKSIVCWSPQGSKLFTASLGIIFRIWNCTDWTAERWDVGEGRVHTACFSPCGQILLFSTTTEPTIYALRSNAEGIWANNNENSPQLAMPVLNLSRDEKSNFGGGLIRNICWSPLGTHLAILFRESKSVAIFNTISHPILKITPCCIVNGLEYERPCAIAFQPNFEHGSCLTIAWGSGRIQYFPLVTSSLVIRSAPSIYREQLDSSIRNASSFRSFS